MNDPRAGFLISSIAWQGVPHRDAISAVREAGFGGVEILCKPGHFEHDNLDHVREVQSALDDWPGAIVTFHAPYYHVDLSSSDSGAREHHLRQVLDAVEAASSFRARNVTVHVRGMPNMRCWAAENVPALERSLIQLADAVARLHMTLSVENLPPPCFTSREDDLLSLFETLPERLVGACIDTGHGHLGGRVLELAHALAPRSFVTHLHDNSARAKDEHLIPGEGTIPWKELVETLRTRGFRGRKVIEVVMVETLGNTLDILKRAIVETGLFELVGR